VRGPPYDLVLASAVREHIPELPAGLSRLFERIRRRGDFDARTLDIRPLAALVRRLDLTSPGQGHDLGSPFGDRLVETVRVDATLAGSAPYPVVTTFASHPHRPLAAMLLKWPARAEDLFRPHGRRWR